MRTVEIETDHEPLKLRITSERSCGDCVYILSGTTGDVCHMFMEDIVDLSIAMECESFTS